MRNGIAMVINEPQLRIEFLLALKNVIEGMEEARQEHDYEGEFYYEGERNGILTAVDIVLGNDVSDTLLSEAQFMYDNGLSLTGGGI